MGEICLTAQRPNRLNHRPTEYCQSKQLHRVYFFGIQTSSHLSCAACTPPGVAARPLKGIAWCWITLRTVLCPASKVRSVIQTCQSLTARRYGSTCQTSPVISAGNMGRKPNPLILEYFIRGAKLEDASNRYHHTCKSCGEQFPKGRIDSLTTHLTKKCPSLSLAERTKIVLRLHDLGDPTENSSKPRGKETVVNSDKGKEIKLPYSPSKQQTFNGLNVLAEASRRVGADELPTLPGYTSAEQTQSQNVPLDPALEVDAFTRHFLNSADDGMNIRANGMVTLARYRHGLTGPGFPATRAPSLPPLFPYLPSGTEASHDEGSDVTGLPINTQPPDLASIAVSANETLAHVIMDTDLEMSHGGMSPGLFDGLPDGHHLAPARASFSWPTLPRTQSGDQPGSSEQTLADVPSQQPSERVFQPLRPLAVNPHMRPTHFVSESGTSTKAQKPKVRGRFTAERRKEVQQIRKQGACIRCRMLKKTCSNDTPCRTCSDVETPRLWKHSCIRTKLIDEFTLFFVGLHSNLAYHDVHNFKARTHLHAFNGRIEAFHFEGPSMMITFKGLQGQADAGLSSPSDWNQNAGSVFLIDTDADDAVAKMEQYLREMVPHVSASDTSHFMKTSLETAQQLAKEKDDLVLFKTLELWTATTILSDIGRPWKLAACPGVAPEPLNTALLPTPPADAAQHDRVRLDEQTTPFSASLITSQLRAAVEKRAGVVCKQVMNELERRLLQRQQSSHFETFLVALILLNCAERVCWLFRTWDDESRLHQWPLDKKPKPYADQGERLAEMVHMILTMRGLQPKVTSAPETGTLTAQEGEQDAVRRWFAELGVSREWLQHCEVASFDPSNSRSLDGKFFARLLLH